jgi:hypothetical protein
VCDLPHTQPARRAIEFQGQEEEHVATIQNQTSPAALANAASGALGSGVFIVPDVVEGGFGRVSKIIIPNITYVDCIRRGVYCIAFKWVLRQLNPQASSCPTPGANCTGDCAHDECACVDGQCI